LLLYIVQIVLLWKVDLRQMIDLDAPVDIRYGENGLVVAVVQEADTLEVLMVAYMNEAALQKTLSTGRSWFYSRSRQELWCKGETSGNKQWVEKVYYDCDADAILVMVHQEGPACHTGQRSCFFRSFKKDTEVQAD